MLRKPALLTFIVLVLLPGADEPRIDPAFPVNERNISPPTLYRPIHDCARVVHVSGFISMALVKIYANGAEVGKGTSLVGEGDIPLTRPLVLGEIITARQIVSGVTSDPSDPVPVDAYPTKLTTPVVSSEIYACGRVAPVDNLVASTRVKVSDVSVAGSPVIGVGETAGRWYPVGTTGLVKDHSVMAIQITCPDTSRTGVSPPSKFVKVKASPMPVPRPVVDQNTVIVEGSDVIVVHSLLPGAEVEIKAGSTVISSGYFATASDTWFPLAIPVPPGRPKITAIQKLCTPSLPSDPVIAVDTITPPVIGSRICAGSRFVSIDKTVLPANVVLLRRTSANPTLTPIGYAGAVLGTLQLKLNKSVTLNAGDVLTAVQYIVTHSGRVIASTPSNEVIVGCDGGANVITQHNDNFRTGAYLSENVLTPKSVLARHMQDKFPRIKLNGSAVTQPLYVREVAFPSGGANAVFVGTLKNSVYALDANNGVQKWRKDLADSNPRRRPVAHGVDTTPVIDIANNRIYFLFSAGNADKPSKYAETKSLDSAYWLVALDLRTGDELARTPVAASVFAGDGSIQTFIAKYQTAHPALLLDHGSIYAAFGSEAAMEGDLEYLKQYHGWLMKYRATDLALQGVFCASPNLLARPNRHAPGLVIAGAGIWQGGGGLAADPDGNIYFLTGNGRVEFENSLYGDSFVKLTSFGNGFFPTAFMPNTPGDPDPDLLETGDADLGSGGPLLIPGANQVIGGGKTGWMYLLDRDTMQFQQRITAARNQYPTTPPHNPWEGWDAGPHLHGSPTFWQGSGRLYVWGEKDFLRAFPFNPATKRFDDTAPAALQGPFKALEMPMPGAMTSLSAKGNIAGTGVLWAIVPVENNKPPATFKGRLYAFDAANLRPLWDGAIGLVPHMAPPTVADGKVFVTNYEDELIVFELGPDGNNLNWNPYTPKLSFTKCQACHQPGQVEQLQRQHPWSERFPNEASLWVLPSRALKSLSPPQRFSKGLAVEGNGVQTYVATESRGKLVWTLKETTADLVELGPDGDPKQEGPVRVRLSRGPVWTASDGSRIVGQIQKTTPAPSEADAPWTLFRVVSTSNAGFLNGVAYIQCVYTHAGQAPATPPKQRGQLSSVSYFAQYWFYR